MNTPWHLTPNVSKAMPSIHARAIFFLIASAQGSVRIGTLDLADQLCCSPRSVKTALDFLAEHGFIIASGAGHSRFFALSETCPEMVDAQSKIAPTAINIAPTSTIIAPTAILDGKIAPTAILDAGTTDQAEGHTLLGTSKNITTKNNPPIIPPRVLSARDSALKDINLHWGVLFQFLGREPYGEHLDRMVSHWEITQETTGQYPTSTELQAAFDWVKQRGYSRTVGSVLTALAASKEGEKSDRTRRQPTTEAKPGPAGEQTYCKIPEGSPWSAYRIPVLPRDESFDHKLRRWNPRDQVPGQLVELIHQQATARGLVPPALLDYPDDLREIAVAAGYHG